MHFFFPTSHSEIGISFVKPVAWAHRVIDTDFIIIIDISIRWLLLAVCGDLFSAKPIKRMIFHFTFSSTNFATHLRIQGGAYEVAPSLGCTKLWFIIRDILAEKGPMVSNCKLWVEYRFWCLKVRGLTIKSSDWSNICWIDITARNLVWIWRENLNLHDPFQISSWFEFF